MAAGAWFPEPLRTVVARLLARKPELELRKTFVKTRQRGFIDQPDAATIVRHPGMLVIVFAIVSHSLEGPLRHPGRIAA